MKHSSAAKLRYGTARSLLGSDRGASLVQPRDLRLLDEVGYRLPVALKER